MTLQKAIRARQGTLRLKPMTCSLAGKKNYKPVMRVRADLKKEYCYFEYLN